MTIADSKPAAVAVPTVTLTIDGVSVTVPKGTLIIRAAETIGVQIPRFCDHPLLDPIGACRQCLVEVEMGGRAMPKPQASCTTEVADGMVVKTQLTSDRAEKAQRGVMEMLLINHPLDCPICDKGGECPLQNQAMSSGQSESRFTDVKRTFPKPINISSQVLLDRERCVLCARCTRFSKQIGGDPFIELFERSALEQVAIYEDEPFQSYFSGNTVQICPVGALTGAAYRFRSRPFDLQSTPSVCEHCASGCAQRTDWRRGKVMRRLAEEDPEVNEEWNCDKGRWAFTYAAATDRFMTPRVRDEAGNLVEASWPEALERAAEGLRTAMTAGGVGVLPGGRLTAEDAYAYAKFARVVLGTNDIDSRARAHSDEELEFLAVHVAGVGPKNGGVTYDELENASSVLLVGFEPEEESPIVFLRLRKAFLKHGQRSFAIAPFETPGTRKIGASIIQTAPGSEAVVLSALGDGSAGGTAAAAVEAIKGESAVVLVGERLAEIPGALRAVSAFVRASGARVAWIPRRAGERGAIDAGALPSMLPGGRLVADTVSREQLAKAWGGDIPGEVGRDLTGILSATKSGELGGLIFGGVDPYDLPDPQLAIDAMDQAKYVVSLEMRPSAVTERADVILPIAPAVEKSGSYTNWEGRRRGFDLTLHNVGAMTDGRVLHALADELDVDLRLPAVESARMELDVLGSTNNRATAGDASLPSIARPDKGSAILASWHLMLDAGSLQDGEEHLAGTARPSLVRLSATTASEIGAEEGDTVTVSTDAGSIRLPLAITPMPDRVVWVPMNSTDSAVRRDLGVPAGSVVAISAGRPA